MTIRDAHTHFFSRGFFQALGRDAATKGDAADVLPARLGWDAPGGDAELAGRWLSELDRHRIETTFLIASVPGDEASVATAVALRPDRFVGGFMAHPGMPASRDRVRAAFESLGLAAVCLFPAMHHVAVDAPESIALFEEAARAGRAVFVHCGVLSIGVRRKLGLSSAFDLRLGDPLAVASVAARFPAVPVVIPHFGAGLFREALMAVQAAPNVFLDTSSSNAWVRLHPGLSLRDVFARALDVAGPSRLLFGTDSSFFPRGWQRPIFEEQQAILTDLGVDAADQRAIFGENFVRVYRQVVAPTE